MRHGDNRILQGKILNAVGISILFVLSAFFSLNIESETSNIAKKAAISSGVPDSVVEETTTTTILEIIEETTTTTTEVVKEIVITTIPKPVIRTTTTVVEYSGTGGPPHNITSLVGCIAFYESTWGVDPNVFQFVQSTWENYGGTGRPENASYQRQEEIFWLAWNDDGPNHWAAQKGRCF